MPRASRPPSLQLIGVLLAGLVLASPAVGQGVAFVGARIHTVSGDVIEPGTVVFADRRITAVGSEAEVPVPAGAAVHDLRGKVVIPGLVDTHSHIGIYPRPLVPAHRDGNDSSSAVQPRLRALDAIWPADPGIRMAVAGGLTTANIMPGSGNVVGGQTAYVKLRGETIEEMLIDKEGVQGGMKMANGENPKRNHGSKGKPPATRMGIAALQRDLFLRAARQRDELALAERKRLAAKPDAEPTLPPKRDLALEPVIEILDGRRIVHHHTHRADDIMSVLRLRDEFDFSVVLHHATEAYVVADEIAAAGVPVSAIVLESPGGKLEAAEYRRDYLGILERAGVLVAIHTDDFITPSRLFLRSGALAVRDGMSEEGALAALTLNGAVAMGLGDRVGSIEVGKDADLVVLSGTPFRTGTQVLETWIDGERVFDRSDPAQKPWATGGPDLYVGAVRPSP